MGDIQPWTGKLDCTSTVSSLTNPEQDCIRFDYAHVNYDGGGGSGRDGDYNDRERRGGHGSFLDQTSDLVSPLRFLFASCLSHLDFWHGLHPSPLQWTLVSQVLKAHAYQGDSLEVDYPFRSESKSLPHGMLILFFDSSNFIF
ncbi:hypothetical protein V6N13_060176 [Hibiscus sabdariffa]|uniref:Uncharacterized protein n=1 Tax=Hibiscus sabdariffa TaxID=183260 RepID=A0ABR2GBR4_9ROSI